MATVARRGLPYIWCTHITKLLAGEDDCLVQPWLKAHFEIQKRPSDFNRAAWTVDHTAMVRESLSRHMAEGWMVTCENQNRFNLKGNVAVLGGKPDLVARKDGRIKVIDCKGGNERHSNHVQVAIYMIVLPMVWGDASLKLEGEIAYRERLAPIQWEEVQPIRAQLFALIKTIAAKDRPLALPSERGCEYCDVMAVDCDKRFGEGTGVDPLTSEF